jgi:outer membrane protein insertion porin family
LAWRAAHRRNKELIFSAEYTFLYSQHEAQSVAFFDAGKAYGSGENIDLNLRYSAGAGFRWMSPMGLIRLEYGYALDRKPGDKSGKLEFSMGSMF